MIDWIASPGLYPRRIGQGGSRRLDEGPMFLETGAGVFIGGQRSVIIAPPLIYLYGILGLSLAVLASDFIWGISLGLFARKHLPMCGDLLNLFNPLLVPIHKLSLLSSKT